MGAREQLQKVIDRKSQEIKDLEMQIEKAKTYIQAVQDSMRFLPREANASTDQILRPGTALDKTRIILKQAGKPLHISELLKALGKPADKKNRLSLSGSLSTYVRSGQIFNRPAPNTFGLIDMAKTVSADPADVDLPEDFGSTQ
jgi:hypothetical protein